MPKINALRNVYFGLLIINLLFIIFTPLLVKGGFLFVEEETLEVIIIALLFSISYWLYSAYKKDVERNKKELELVDEERKNIQERLDDAFKYIGSVNVQIQEIKSIFSQIDKYPENKKDLKLIFQYLADKILGIIDIDWVLLRIIHVPDFNTMNEHCATRSSAVMLKYKIPNKNLIKNNAGEDYLALTSDQTNLNIKAFAIFPKRKITENQKILIKAIINQLEMFFIIFASSYYKNNYLLANGKN